MTIKAREGRLPPSVNSDKWRQTLYKISVVEKQTVTYTLQRKRGRCQRQNAVEISNFPMAGRQHATRAVSQF